MLMMFPLYTLWCFIASVTSVAVPGSDPDIERDRDRKRENERKRKRKRERERERERERDLVRLFMCWDCCPFWSDQHAWGALELHFNIHTAKLSLDAMQ